MKLTDIFIYICLIGCGVIFGWFLKSASVSSLPQTNSPEPIISLSTIPKQKHLEFPKNEMLPVLDLPEQQPVKAIEKKDITNSFISLPPPENSSLTSKAQNQNKSQQDMINIQKDLDNNDFFAAIKSFAVFRNKEEKGALYTESLNLLTNFVQTKAGNKEQQTILADIEKALGFYPGWWPLIVLKGQAYIAMGNFEEGAKSLKGEMFYITNENEQKDLLAFIRVLRSKRMDQLKSQKLGIRLIEYYEELIVEDSAFVPYYFELGKLYIEKHDFYNALVILGIIVSDATYGKEADALISQIIATQESEAAKQIVKFENKNAIEIPIIRVNDRYFVLINLNDKLEAKFLIDTGASISIISSNLASKLGYSDYQLKDLRWFQTAGGMVKQPMVKLLSLTVGAVKMNNVMAAVSNSVGSEFDGLLGMNFLGRFNLEIVQDRNLLILKRK